MIYPSACVPATTGTIVNGLLDAAPCTNSSVCYALNLPKVLNNGNILTKTGDGYLQRDIDGHYLLVNGGLTNYFTSIKSVALRAINKIMTISNYYIWYAGEDGRVTRSYLEAINYCQNLGNFRLPGYNEVDQSNANIGIPSQSYGSTRFDYSGYYAYFNTGSGQGLTVYDQPLYTRCVYKE